MNKKIAPLILFAILSITIFGESKAHAIVSPLSISIVPPIQFPSQEFTVTGVRVSALWGKHRDIYGIDLGVLGNMTEGVFVGAGISGIFNLTEGKTTILGLQLAGLANINSKEAKIFGLQLALGLNENDAASTLVGLQIAALANLSGFTNIYGAQIGLYNKALEVYGLQVGLVNSTKNLHGIQIGLLNFNDGGLFKVSPILNVGF
jgi:hypothetical protein